MPPKDDGYSVGNLKITFSAINETSKSFTTLKKNLEAITSFINGINTSNLRQFYTRMQSITRIMSPFLSQIEKSTAGLQAFNDVARQVGIKNMSAVVTELDEIERKTRAVTESQRELNVEIEDGANAAPVALEKSLSIFNTASRSIDGLTGELRGVNLALYEVKESAGQILPAFNAFDFATQEMSRLSSAWKNMYADMSTSGDMYDSTVLQTLNELSSEFLRNKQIVDDTNEAWARLNDEYRRSRMSIEELTIEDYKNIQSTRQKRIAYLEAALAMGTAGDQTREFRKELERLRKEDGKLGKKSGLSKFLGQLKRISIYRMIRAGLKSITNAFKEGVKTLAEYDSGINHLMSQVTTSTTIIKTSMGATLLPILQAIQPLLQQIAVGFANMANVINASMSKTGYYTKINTDRLLAYNKAANLFDFDKFRSLNKGDDATSLFSTEKVEDLNDELGVSAAKYKLIYDIIKNIGEILANVFTIVGQIFDTASPILTVILAIADGILYVVRGITWLIKESGLLYPIVGGILGYFIALGVTKFITWLKSGALVTWFKNAAAGASTFGGKLLGVLGTTQALAVGIGALAGSLMYFIQNLDEMGTTAKVIIPIIAALAAVITGVAVARAAAAAGIAAPAMAGVTAAALAAAITLAAGTAIGVAVGKYANGGIPPQGTLFYAGEAGAEMVYNTPSGQSGVANIQQIAQAVYQGTYQATMDWWKTAKNEIGGDVYLDSEKIYQGVGRAAGRHGKRFADVR